MPEARAIELLALSPAYWAHGLALLAFVVLTCSLLRNALMLEAVLSRAAHLAVCTLTLLPAVLLAAVLVFAAAEYPARAWGNLAIAACAYVPWYLGGAAARLVCPDVDADDARWLALGACITFPAGVIAAIAFG